MDLEAVELIRNHSHYSLLMSTSRSEQIVDACVQAGYDAVGITDVGTISGCVDFIQSCKKKNVKPIIGSEIILFDGSRITLLCKNINAWNSLLQVISACNRPDNYQSEPRISIEELLSLINPDDYICIDGYIGSRLFYKLMPSQECVFAASSESCVAQCLIEGYESVIDQEMTYMASLLRAIMSKLIT